LLVRPLSWNLHKSLFNSFLDNRVKLLRAWSETNSLGTRRVHCSTPPPNQVLGSNPSSFLILGQLILSSPHQNQGKSQELCSPLNTVPWGSLLPCSFNRQRAEILVNLFASTLNNFGLGTRDSKTGATTVAPPL
jgi:hypothetical protein